LVQRPDDYTKLDDPLAIFAPQVFFCFFGFNESFAGPGGISKFEGDYRRYLADLRQRFTAEGEAPRLVLVSPIAFESTGHPLQPSGARENANLRAYADAVGRVAAAEGVAFVDLFAPTLEKFDAEQGAQFTINGAHLNAAGDRLVADVIDEALFGGKPPAINADKLCAAVVDLQWRHFQDYRMLNGWYVYGSRSQPLDTHTFRPEYAKVRKMCADRDRVIWALAKGETPPAVDDSEPELPETRTTFGSKSYSEPKELRYLSPAEAEQAMTVAPGYRVQTFASEEDFPELAKPVQMAFDNRGRLWVACMPTYPQWRPSAGYPTDKLLILEDTDGDGRADKRTVFADDLHCPVGFEFYNGGVLVVSQPKLLWLKDTDGDDKSDVREVVLDGFASQDTHHAISAFEWTPDGKLLMLEGIMMSTAVETPWGPFRNKNQSVVYSLDPRRWRLETHLTPCYANPWCYTHNDWGQGFVGDGTQAVQHWATPMTGAQFAGRRSNDQFISYPGDVMRPALGNGFLYSRHFPPAAQGNFFYACVINMNGILQFKVENDGSGYHGTRIEDLVRSTDRNFRPGDPQIGPDGALYFIDWHNPLIGHMQYSQRDPNRDHTHGRVYRLYAEGRPLVKPVTQQGKSIPELLEQLREYEPQTTYRVRRELRDRPTADVTAAVKAWMSSLDPGDPQRELLMCQAMWVLAGHHVADRGLITQLVAAKAPDARAAALHMVADHREFVPDALELAIAAMKDPHPRVRVEALRALSFFAEPRAVEAALTALGEPLDDESSYTLESTITALRPTWEAARKRGVDLTHDNPVAQAFLERIAAGNDRGREVKSLVEAIVQQEQPGRHASAIARLMALPARTAEGAKVFQRSCRACHRVGTDGAAYAPNLSDVGKRLSREEILQSILFPNAKIEDKYRATNIYTDDGKALSGLVIEENDKEVSLLLGQGTLQKIAKDLIEERREVDVSSMPERLNEAMSGEEFIDLLQFLAEQRTTPEPNPTAASGGR
jgi:putative heme-binding domain-containing protein